MLPIDPDPTAPLFMGRYPFMVDGQWRMTIPSAWRFAKGAEFYFRLMRDHLRVLPRSEIERFRRWANELPGADRAAAHMEWGETTSQAVLDKSGRLTLPSAWAEKVGIAISTQALLVGATEYFQIWNPEAHAADAHGLRARGRNLVEAFG